MGKANPTNARAKASTHLKNKQEKGSVWKKILIIAAAVVIIAGVVLLNVYVKMDDSGYKERKTAALESENFSLSQTQMSYYTYLAYTNMVSMYSAYGLDVSQMGIDTSKPLSQQQCTIADNQTWLEYFLDQAKETGIKLLSTCEAAKAEGLEFGTDADKAYVDVQMDSLESTAKSAGYSLSDYIARMYGSKVNKDDIRGIYELTRLASNYLQVKSDAADVSDDVLESTYAANPEKYDKATYLSYTFDYKDLLPEAEEDDAAETTDGEEEEKPVDPAVKAEAMAKIKASADELLKVKDEDAFIAFVKDHLANDLGLEEDEVESAAGKVKVEAAAYSDSSDKDKWIFSAKAGEINMFEEGEDDAAEVLTVVMVLTPRGRDESKTVDVRHILFKNENYSDDSKAQKVLDEWKNGEKTEDSFASLAIKYSEDPGSVAKGGLYEGVTKGSMVSEFDGWCFDEARAEGDCEIVKAESTGWHIIYYVGSKPAWKTTIINEIKDEASSKAQEEVAENYADAVRENEEAMKALAK